MEYTPRYPETSRLAAALADIEALLTSIDTNVGLIETHVGSIDTNIADIETQLAGVIGTDDSAKPAHIVMTGGVYESDIFAAALSANNDAGQLILDQYRRLYIRDGVASDIVSNANRNIPVYINEDRYEPLDFSNAVATNSATYYWNADGNKYWSLRFESTTVETFTLTVSASNDATQPDITLRNYDSVHTELFGAATSTFLGPGGVWLIMDTDCIFNSYRLSVSVTGNATWTAQGKKGLS